jgi:F5/8 type C domain
MAAHAYWRVHITTIQNPGPFGPFARIGELRMYDVSGTSLCSGGTPIASDSFSGNPASNAFDNNVGTYWANNTSITTQPAWIGYHFASAVSVATVNILSANVGLPGSYPAAFTIDSSDDGVTWTAQAAFTSTNGGDPLHSAGWSFAVVAPLAGAYCSYRINCSGVFNEVSADTILIAQVTMFDGGSNLAVPPYTLTSWPGNATYGFPEMDSLGGGSGSDQAFNGTAPTPTEHWISGGPSTPGIPGWLSYNFQVPTVIKSFCVYAFVNTGMVENAPQPFTFEASNNGGETWTVLGSFTFPWTTSPVGSNPQCTTLGPPSQPGSPCDGIIAQPTTDVQFELRRVYATLAPHKRLPVRGS